MAAARSRLDVAQMLRAHDQPRPVDETFVAVLAAQARAAASTEVAAGPRRVLRLAGAAVAVVASTVGVAFAASQGLFVPPEPENPPPATSSSDTAQPGPVTSEDLAEREADDQAGRLDASADADLREHSEDGAEAEGSLAPAGRDTGTAAQSRPVKPGGGTTEGSAAGQHAPGSRPGDDDSGEDGTDDRTKDTPQESEAPEPESEGSGTDEPESEESESEGSLSEDGTGSAGSDPEPDETAGSSSVEESGEDAVSR